MLTEMYLISIHFYRVVVIHAIGFDAIVNKSAACDTGRRSKPTSGSEAFICKQDCRNSPSTPATPDLANTYLREEIRNASKNICTL